MIYMAINKEDLMQGSYYIHETHGICQYKDVEYLNMKGMMKKYYSFT